MDEYPELKPFQRAGVDFLIRRKRACLFDEMGLGKTVQLIMAMEELGVPQKPGGGLILGSKSSLAVWKRELPIWAPNEKIKLITASNKHRDREGLWRDAFNEFGYTLANYDTWRVDFGKGHTPQGWKHITGDEAHQIANRNTARFKSIELEAKRAESLFWATGSPMSRGPQNIFTLLHTIEPRIFTSYWKFVSTWTHVEKTAYGVNIGPPKNIENFKRMLAIYALQRLKIDVAPEVPQGFRSPLPVEFDDALLEMYEELEDESLAELPDENLVVNTNTLVRLLHLRQFCVTPRLLGPTLPYGPGLEKIGEMLMETEDHHCVVYTCFTEAIPIIKQYFVEELGVHPDHVYTLQGGADPGQVALRSEQFQKNRGVMICSVKFAQSFEFLTPKNVFFLGFDWDPEVNKQAERRTERLVTRHVVNYWYVVCIGSVDERVLETCVLKNLNVSAVVKTADDLRKIFYGR